MKISKDEIELISKIAADHEIKGDVIVQLLELEEEFPDVHAWGARANLKRKIAQTLEQAANQANPTDPNR